MNTRTAEPGLVNFPNPSRSYDDERHGIHFWGYDQALEISYFIEAQALTKVSPDLQPDEAGFLGVFDAHYEQICAAADKRYTRQSKAPYIFAYTLTAADF
ncbi:MAG: DUF1488 domain-containing protein [Gammaproteobacteria bacterium]|nr:DUF1488 domain-containing protein [Gammaproteobacteria bacterium]